MNTKSKNNTYTIEKGDASILGTTRIGNVVNFAVSLPEYEECILKIYRMNTDEPLIEYKFTDDDRLGFVYSIKIKGLGEKSYEYEYFAKKIKDRESVVERIVDKYSKVLTNRRNWGILNTKPVRGVFLKDNFNWGNDIRLGYKYSESIIYNMHVRGFTKHVSSKVRKKGTFIGICEKIDYLKSIGITAIELMPAYEFNELTQIEGANFPFKKVEDVTFLNYWGYTDAMSYFAPKAAYSYSKDVITEFKTMVKALHNNGIEVIMEFYFDNSIRYRLIKDCIGYWIREFHIDGFRVSCDEVSLSALACEPEFSNVKIMSNGFNLEYIYADKVPRLRNLAEYNDGFMYDMRKFLKGDEDMLNAVIYRNKKNDERCATINYMATHNGFNLNDMVSYESKHNEKNGENNRDGNNYNYSWNCGAEGPTKKKYVLALRSKQVRNALVMQMLSQGTPVIWGGDEFLNTQNGNNNPYCQDNDISWINWNLLNKNIEFFEFFKQLIKFRKEHGILRNESQLREMDYLSCGYPDLSYHGEKAWYAQLENYNRQLGVMYCGKYAKNANGKEDDFVYVAYNMHWVEHEFALPNLPQKLSWKRVIDTTVGFVNEKVAKKSIIVEPRSIVVLISK